MGFSVKVLGFFDIVDFNALYQKSFSEFKSELEKCGYAYKNIDQKYIFDNYIYTCIADKSIVLLYDNDNLIGYEFMYICPDDKSIITMAYTYIVNEYRGKKLSYLLREKMFEIIKEKNIRKIYFSISNDNDISINNMKHYADNFKITEMSKNYLIEL